MHFTSRDKLNNELGWENMQTRINFLGLSFFHKIHLHETRPLIKKCMTELDYAKKYLTRSKGGYSPHPNYGEKFKKSFFPYISKLWNNLSVSTQLMTLPDFKEQLKKELKPPKIKHFSKGSKIGNKFLTRVRLERSDLNLHTFSIGLSESSECLCHAKNESSLHYLIDCFLYSGERQTLFNLVEHYIPNFKQLTKAKKYDILVNGLYPDNPDYYSTNTTISISVQNFIFKTKRFSEFC